MKAVREVTIFLFMLIVFEYLGSGIDQNCVIVKLYPTGPLYIYTCRVMHWRFYSDGHCSFMFNTIIIK